MFNVVPAYEAPLSWAVKHFGSIELGDKRRNNRVVEIAQLMASHPGASIPGMTSSEYEMKATYNLLGHPQATADNLQSAHRDYVRKGVSVAGETFLFIQDLTAVSYTGRNHIEGLGPIGHGLPGQQGYHIHTVLAARWNFDAAAYDGLQRRPAVQVLGLADQQFFVRTPRPADEGTNAKTKRLKRHRESEYWGWATERMRRVPPGCDWVRVCDREADIYPFLMECTEYGYSFVVRASQNRALAGQQACYVFDEARQVESLGQFEVRLRGRNGKAARVARLNVGICGVSIRAPFRHGGKADALECNVLRIWEDCAPAGEEALEWILLTDRRASCFDEALEIAMMYCSRWLIEEFHKVLKTGMGAERLQLESGEGLMAAGAIMSVVALRLLELKENVRVIPNAPARQAGLSDLELEVLEATLERKISTVSEVILSLGALGGHKGRKTDGMPGWQTLWHGIIALNRIVEGVILAQKVKIRFSQ